MAAILKGLGKAGLLRTTVLNSSSPLGASLLPTTGGTPTLLPLSLSNNTINENSPAGTVVGSIQNTTAGSALSLSATAGGRFKIVGTSLQADTVGTDYETATSHSVTIVETLAGATGSPKSTTLTIGVVNQNDTAPSAFSFTDVTGAAASTLQTSNTITIAGLSAFDTATAALSGEPSSQMQVNGGSWVSGPVTVANGDTIAVRHTSAATTSATVNTTLTVGTTSDSFSSTTGTVAPAISSVTASGIKRQGEMVWLAVDADNTANKYRFDVQAGGASLTGVSVNDNGTTSSVSFPYVTTSSRIGFIVPAGMVFTSYAMTGAASSDAGVSYGTAVAADENFVFPSTFFTPSTIATPTLVRVTASGVVPATLTIDGTQLSDSYIFRVTTKTADGVTTKAINYVPLSEGALTTPYTADLSGATEPAPYPAMTAWASDDLVVVEIMSADYDGTHGVISGAVSVNLSDALAAMVFSATDKDSNVTVSGGNLTAAWNGGGGSNTAGVRTNRGVSSGKVYWETAVSNVSSRTRIGVASGSASVSASWTPSQDGGSTTNQAAVRYGGAYEYDTSGQVALSPTLANGDALDTALDIPNKKVWWRVNNGAWGPGASADPATNTGGLSISAMSTPIFPAAQFSFGGSVTANYGPSFTRTPPTGFVAA